MWRGPQWSQSEGGPRAHAAVASLVPKRSRPVAHVEGASVVIKRRRPPDPCGGGLGDSKAERAPYVAVGLVVSKQRRPPRPCGGGLGGPKAKEAPAPIRRWPPWSPNGGDPSRY